MLHSAAGQSSQDDTTPQVRRSARPRRASAKRIPLDDTRNIQMKRKREDIGNDSTDAPAAQKVRDAFEVSC